MNGETQQACKAGSNRVLTAVGVALRFRADANGRALRLHERRG